MVQRTDLGQKPGLQQGLGKPLRQTGGWRGSPWSRRSSASGNSDPGTSSDPAVE